MRWNICQSQISANRVLFFTLQKIGKSDSAIFFLSKKINSITNPCKVSVMFWCYCRLCRYRTVSFTLHLQGGIQPYSTICDYRYRNFKVWRNTKSFNCAILKWLKNAPAVVILGPVLIGGGVMVIIFSFEVFGVLHSKSQTQSKRLKSRCA